MKIFKILLLSLSILITGNLQSQDIHYTLFNYSPLTLNPALTGAYQGSFRIGGIYRDQWGSVLSNQFQTPSFYADAPLFLIGKKKKNWLGVGAVLFSDKAGFAGLSNNGIMGSAALHIPTDKKATSVFTIGVQVGMRSRNVDADKLCFEGDLGPIGLGCSDQSGVFVGGNSADLDASQLENSSFLDFSAGLLYRSESTKQTDVTIGLSVNHITSPNYALLPLMTTDTTTGTGFDRSETDLPLRIALHGEFNFDMSKKWELTPTFLINQITNMNELALQGWLGYKLKEKKTDDIDVKLRFGVGYRVGDAAKLLLGMDYGAFRAAVAYDVNISTLKSETNTVGGFELALSYIAKIYKEPEIKPSIFCPKF